MALKHQRKPSEVAEIVAIQALSFLAGQPERLGLFLSESGIGPETLRAAAASPPTSPRSSRRKLFTISTRRSRSLPA